MKTAAPGRRSRPCRGDECLPIGRRRRARAHPPLGLQTRAERKLSAPRTREHKNRNHALETME